MNQEKTTIGTTLTHSFSFTQEQVIEFAKISGDHNPIHLSEEYAAQTPFKKPIIHGILSASIFSYYFGTVWPGEGTIYMKQLLEFQRPMFVNNEYEAQITVKQIDYVKNIAIIECKVIDKATKKITLCGEASLLHKVHFASPS